MKAIYEQIINILFLFLGKYLTGYRAKIVAVITGITGIISILSQTLAGFCDQFHVLCFMSTPLVTSIILTWGGISAFILKKLDNIA